MNKIKGKQVSYAPQTPEVWERQEGGPTPNILSFWVKGKVIPVTNCGGP
jgi:hypothetical protein